MAYTTDQLKSNSSLRANMTYDQLINAGFNPLEAATAKAGYEGNYTAGTALKFRTDKGLNDTSVVQNYGSTSLPAYLSSQVNNPQPSAEFVPTLQTPQANELLTNNYNVAPTAYSVATPTSVVTPTITAGQVNPNIVAPVDPNAVVGNINAQTGQAGIVKTTAVDPMVAAQGTVSDLSTVQGQLKKLYADFDEANPPAWAKGAINAAENATSSRGLGASTIAGTAVAQAIQQQAINIAAPDAATYFQMDIKNLDNEQQANLVNFQARQQNMLTDTAIENAGLQFNATSDLQKQQYVSSTINNIQQFNAGLKSTLEQFNVSEANKIAAQNAGNQIQVDEFNNQQEVAIGQFNSQLASQRETFNNQMQFAIDQSNVVWRRQVNTANTASLNAANQANVQNAFNLSQSSLNSLLMLWRDQIGYEVTSSENQATRDFQAAMAANNFEFLGRNDRNAMDSIGSFVGSLTNLAGAFSIGGSGTGAGAAQSQVNNLISTNSDGIF